MTVQKKIAFNVVVFPQSHDEMLALTVALKVHGKHCCFLDGKFLGVTTKVATDQEFIMKWKNIFKPQYIHKVFAEATSASDVSKAKLRHWWNGSDKSRGIIQCIRSYAGSRSAEWQDDLSLFQSRYVFEGVSFRKKKVNEDASKRLAERSFDQPSEATTDKKVIAIVRRNNFVQRIITARLQLREMEGLKEVKGRIKPLEEGQYRVWNLNDINKKKAEAFLVLNKQA